MDVIWTGGVRQRRLDQASSRRRWPSRSPTNVFPSVVKTASFEGKLYGAPFNSNTQLLWYRKDLVPEAADDLGPDDRRGREARVRGKAGHDPGAGQQVRGLHGLGQRADRRRRARRSSPARRPSRLQQKPTEEALEVMGRLAALAGRGHRHLHLDRGHGAARLRGGHVRLHGQLHVRLRERAGERPGRRQGDGLRRVSAGRARATRPSRPSAGSTSAWAPTRTTRTSRSRRPRASSNAKSELTATELDGLPPSRSNLYTNKVVTKAYPGLPRWSRARSRRRARGR